MTTLVGPILERAATLSPRSVAASLDDTSVTFAQVHQGANRVAHVLHGVGVGADDRIASWTDIALGSLDVYFAAARLLRHSTRRCPWPKPSRSSSISGRGCW